MQSIDRKLVEEILTPELCLELSHSAFMLVSQGKVKQTLRSVIASDQGSLMGTMPAYITEGRYAGFGLKTVKVDFKHKNKRTSHEGYILLYDAPNEGEIALIDAASVTEFRTAAASAFATNILAPKDASHLTILGTGVQAKKHVQMMINIRPIKHITIWGRNNINANIFASWCQTQFNLPITIASTPAQAVSNTDIICTVTASKEAFLYAKDLPSYCHINAIGASSLDFQEIAPDVYKDVALYTDSKLAVWNSSACLLQARQHGYLSVKDMGTEIGELLLTEDKPISQKTLFKSVGIAAQDLVFAREIISHLKNKG